MNYYDEKKITVDSESNNKVKDITKTDMKYKNIIMQVSFYWKCAMITEKE